MADWIAVRVFSSRMEAEIAKSLLDSEGIASFVQADDQAGMRPHLALTGGVKLLVAESDRAEALDILNATPVDSPEK